MNPKDKHADWLLKPTANDLADELDRMLKAIGLTGNRIPTILRQQEVEIKRITSKYEEMLRQQQAEIEELKSANRFIQNFAEEQHQRAVALEMRELTDEEILECWNETHPAVVCLNAELPLFARAILRKAQEK